MRIVVAPDKFKGTQTAREAAENIAAGMRDILPQAEIIVVPVADGGEGTAEVIYEASGGSWRECAAHDLLGQPISARYAQLPNEPTAVMEMCEVAGRKHLDGTPFDVERADTFGVGEMILAAARSDARRIIIGLGGSKTNDGGFGMARALGFRFLDDKGRELTNAVSALRDLAKIDSASVVDHFSQSTGRPKIIGAADVRNPLLGRDGATHVFGPQKSASAAQLQILEDALQRLADVVTTQFGIDFRSKSGAGAAGGLGFGLMTFCGAALERGFDVVSNAIDFENKVRGADVIVTGEGSLDRQTLEGKGPAEVALLARRLGKRVFAIVGRSDGDDNVSRLFDGIYAVTESGETDRVRTGELLRKGGQKLATALMSDGARHE